MAALTRERHMQKSMPVAALGVHRAMGGLWTGVSGLGKTMRRAGALRSH